MPADTQAPATARPADFDDDDMAEVGRSLMERIEGYQCHPLVKGWHPAQDPAEILDHLLNGYDELRALLKEARDQLWPASPRAGDTVKRIDAALGKEGG